MINSSTSSTLGMVTAWPPCPAAPAGPRGPFRPARAFWSGRSRLALFSRVSPRPFRASRSLFTLIAAWPLRAGNTLLACVPLLALFTLRPLWPGLPRRNLNLRHLLSHLRLNHLLNLGVTGATAETQGHYAKQQEHKADGHQELTHVEPPCVAMIGLLATVAVVMCPPRKGARMPNRDDGEHIPRPLTTVASSQYAQSKRAVKRNHGRAGEFVG